MNLVDESVVQKNNDGNSKKMKTIILISISVLIIAIIAVFVAIYYIKESELKLYIDGVQNDKVREMMSVDSDGTVYFPIKEIAAYLGYESFNGEYTEKSEEQNKCYIQCENEIANFALNQTKVYKLNTTNNNNYEYFYSSKAVKSIQGKLYAASDAIEKAFNISFEYDTDKQRVYIYTMPYLVNIYETKVLDYGYEKISQDFTNQKAILNNMIVVSKNQNKAYAVIDLKGNAILEAKYDYIEYIPTSGDFLVKSNNKVGIMSAKRQTKIKILYDDLELIDADSGLYVAKKENKYGVLDSNEEIKIYIEYDQIGIDNTKFMQNDIKNKYLLSNGMIPVRKDKLWGAFDTNGNQVINLEFDSFGYVASTNKDAINLLIIPDYELLIGCKNKKYTLINASGEEIIKPVLDDVYMSINGGKKYYFMNAGDQSYNIIEFLEAQGVKPENTKSKNNSKNGTAENNDTENNNVNSISNEINSENANENQETQEDTNEENQERESGEYQEEEVSEE